jgi:hypothetical protein
MPLRFASRGALGKLFEAERETANSIKESNQMRTDDTTPSRLPQWWSREAIESVKGAFRKQAPIAKPARPHAEIIDGGCLLYHLPAVGPSRTRDAQ